MNELSVKVNVGVGSIDFNLQELKDNLAKEMQVYENLVVTEDTVKDSKKDLAMLRKASKELNDRKIAVKKEFLAPYTAFESEVKDAIAIIEKPISLIDAQIKQFEEEQKIAKKKHLEEVFQDQVGELGEYITFSEVFKESWLNATAKDKDAIDEIQIAKMKVEGELQAIKSLASEIEPELLSHYKRTHSLAECIQRNTNYLETKRLAEERVRREEEERKAREEQERLAKEQAAKQEEMVAEQDLPKEEVNEPLPQWEDIHEQPTHVDNNVTIVIPAEDKDKVIQFLMFSGISYEVRG